MVLVNRNDAIIITVGIALVVLTFISHVQGGVYSHYSFDSDYRDSSGNGRHGALTDVGTMGDSGITADVTDLKFGGGALNLTSDRDYVAIPSKTFSSGIPYSIAFWAKKAPGDTGEGLTDANNAAADLGLTVDQTTGTNPADIASLDFTFEADGINDVEIQFFEVNNLGTPSIVLSGFDLRRAEVIPEPVTMALLGLAVCGLGGYVRRRRKA